MIQSGDGDWIINSHATEMDSGARFFAVGLQKKVFLFGGLSPGIDYRHLRSTKQKNTSLRLR
jgi:hypothetical protein